ncbi:phosphate/phosphite/phosphonate ABC transporter substrate-binding protein [Pyxidicoccus xibeiensis]|uniref:phosphate/phosphite/phosphonate ABC transporter substrate-binding protein n=1 Tax=Pyxidicoccus xibeiensis TaxID=2906759 RepID=UPI0020A7CAAD|nr:phosphate/phosphite/phosphonate ABC transporter substrate-binding protein [Pyxidicoccus xibeiensis]MCP3138217.1 phosphate/phosphite/phosphonate ABC transporter substrate-binding protein [Pyxidicoccus xibeiensis]
MSRFVVGRLALGLLGLVLLLPGCTGRDEAGDPPTVGQTTASVQGEASREPQRSGPPIRIAMSAAFVSESGTGVYAKLADWLARELGRQVEFVSGFSYGTIDEMIDDGAVDVGFICGYPYVLKHDRPEPVVDVLAAPVVKSPRYKDQPLYFSDLIVREGSRFQRFEDLEGATLVYNEEKSNSGYNMPRSFLIERGLTKGFFGKVIRSGSHEESIRMVAEGEADASFVDSLVLDYDREKGLGSAGQVRVLMSLGPEAIPPVVVSTQMAPELRERMRAALTHMHEDPEGRRILDEALLSRFAPVEDAHYDGIRRRHALAQRTGFMSLR